MTRKALSQFDYWLVIPQLPADYVIQFESVPVVKTSKEEVL
ncbi:hypothetical protein BH24ACI3_BH24ACI3_17400 [soil metagenome]